MQFEMIAAEIEKKELCTLVLIFQPGEKPLSEFDKGIGRVGNTF